MEEFKEAEAAGEGEAAVEEFFPIKSTAGGAGGGGGGAGLASASASLVAVQVVRPSKTSKGSLEDLKINNMFETIKS